jgi:hypothetical protein
LTGSQSFFMLWHSDDLVLGRTGRWSFFPPVAVPQPARSGHMYVVGKTGKGKSKFLEWCLYQDIASGRGCGVIDPHSDLIADLLVLLYSSNHLESEAARNRIIYLNPADHTHVIPFNVLAVAGEPYRIAQNVIEAFHRTWPGSLAAAPHFDNVMLHSLLLLIQAKLTLIHLPRLLLDNPFRTGLLEQNGDKALHSFFTERYDQWGKDAPAMRESTLNKVTALSLNPHLKFMLGQQENRLDFRRMMDEGQVLLADLGHCDEESQRLFGSLITTGIEQAAFSREDVPPAQRRPWYLAIDEFQDFVSNSVDKGGVKTLSRILSGARKFGLHLTLAHQNLSQLSPRMRGAVLGNTWTKVILGVSEDDAREISRWISLGTVDPYEIKHEAKTETQHPVTIPLSEQEHELATMLCNQVPRKAIVRDHEGKTRQMWTVPLSHPSHAYTAISEFRRIWQQRHGNPLAAVEAELAQLYSTVSEVQPSRKLAYQLIEAA